MDNVTAAVQDVLTASGILAWDGRYNAAVARTTRALTSLAEAAELNGVAEAVWAGFFKLSAREPHRLAKLVDSIAMLRLPDVGRALLAYDAAH